jgi:hypothetical protein
MDGRVRTNGKSPCLIKAARGHPLPNPESHS